MKHAIEAKVMSLTTAEARRKLISANLEFRQNISWEFFDALTADSLVPELQSNNIRQIANYGRPLTRSEVGCFKSHYVIWQNFLINSTSDWLLVLEDDVWIDPDFDFSELIVKAKGLNINYVRLFAKMYKPADVVCSMSGFRQLLRFRTDPYGTQAYLINKKGCKAFIDSIKHIDVPIDDAMGRFWIHKQDPYCIFPFPAVERSVVSSITQERDAGGVQRRQNAHKTISNRLRHKIAKTIYNIVYYIKR